MKTCKDCKQEKQESDFYARDTACKECRKACVRLHRRTHPSVREYDRERAKTPERVAKATSNTARWLAEHPEAYRAQTAVGNALRSGVLKKSPCQVCDGENDIHAHHNDYSRALDVVWLCAKCHHRIHALFPQVRGHHVTNPLAACAAAVRATGAMVEWKMAA
jgi:hypothetical protein